RDPPQRGLGEGHADAGEKPPQIAKAAREAWGKRGFAGGWIRDRTGSVEFPPEYPKDGDALPALSYLGSPPDLTADGLKDLPPVNIPFALSIANRNDVTDAGLEHIARLPNLTWLDVSSTRITSQGVKPLAGLKNLT